MSPETPTALVAGPAERRRGRRSPRGDRSDKRRVIGLDLLRFFAAFAVMAFHLAYWSWWPAGGYPKYAMGGAAAFPELAPLTWWGWVGVAIFFVISGLVITSSANCATARSFAVRRFLRLAPSIWICASLTFTAWLVLGAETPGRLLLMYLHTLLLSPLGGWIDGVYWSLAVEIVFYVLVFLLLALKRLPTLQPLLLLLGWVSAAAWALRGLHQLQPAVPIVEQGPVSQLVLDNWIFFSLGALVQRSQGAGWTLSRTVNAAAFATAGVVCIWLQGYQSLDMPAPWAVQAIAPAIWLLAMAALLLLLRWDEWLARRLTASQAYAIATLGLATYPLYLLHDVLGAATIRWLVAAGMDRFAALVLALGAMIVLALAVTLGIEPRLRAWTRSALLGDPLNVPARGMRKGRGAAA